MAVMQRQESFNRFYQEFVVDEAPRCVKDDSLESPGVCIYKNEDTGKGCAIGIQPEFQDIYDKRFEQRGIAILYKRHDAIKAIINYQDLGFFASLQMLHDNGMQNPKTFNSRLINFAATFGVKIPEKIEDEATE